MTVAAAPGRSETRALRRAVGALTATQLIGWSTTYHLPAVLAAPMARDLGLPTSLAFGGVTIMLLVAAALAPWAGRVLERRGARRPAVAGSLSLAAGLAVLAVAPGPLGFALAWTVMGAAMPFALSQTASTALVQISPGEARRAIALLLLLSGASAVGAWPALLWLEGALGWRGCVGVCAAANLLACAPLHRFGLPRGRVVAAEPSRAGGPPAEPEGPPVPGSFGLAAFAFALAGALTWGMPLQLVGVLGDYGFGEAAAVGIGALFAPGQVASRLFEYLGGKRYGILPLGVAASALMPVAFAIQLLGGSVAAVAALFAFGYGFAAGLTSIVRAVAPIRLFGAAAYAIMLGRLTLPMNAAFGVAPLGFAAIRETWGGPALMAVGLGLSLVCLVPMWMLERRAAAVDRAAQATT